MLNSYIIKNGTLISILTGNCRQADILVENGVITKIEEHKISVPDGGANPWIRLPLNRFQYRK